MRLQATRLFRDACGLGKRLRSPLAAQERVLIPGRVSARPMGDRHWRLHLTPALQPRQAAWQGITQFAGPEPDYVIAKLQQALVADLIPPAGLLGPSGVFALAVDIDHEAPFAFNQKKVCNIRPYPLARRQPAANRMSRLQQRLPPGSIRSWLFSIRDILGARLDLYRSFRPVPLLKAADVGGEPREITDVAALAGIEIANHDKLGPSPCDRNVEEVRIRAEKRSRADGQAICNNGRQHHDVALISLEAVYCVSDEVSLCKGGCKRRVIIDSLQDGCRLGAEGRHDA